MRPLLALVPGEPAGIGPELASLGAAGRLECRRATDAQALEALKFLAASEGVVFALESAVLRAEKAAATATEQRREEYRAIVMLCAFTAKQRLVEAVARCAAYIGEAESPAAMAAVTSYRPDGLLAAQRLIAAAVSQAERYIF